MRLAKVKLAGFKSFVDPTTIEIPSNLVGIVGPNGCGKSNVIDAVRWVMGETSAKHLRGDSMADVIFNGSASRKPVGTASIELFFDNSDGAIGGEYARYTEVSIRRAVSRDGTSQYFLNNVRCRRKDITGIFLGTGLGPRSYAIIEQGMISRLIEAKPDELRTYIEEAAGISKYKERRRETENRIRHTRDNLDRLNDLREEIDNQIKHLQKQARAAERHKVLINDQRRTEAEVLAIRLREIDTGLQQERMTFESHQTELEAAIAAKRKVEADIESARAAQNLATEKHNETFGRQIGIQGEVARIEESIHHNKKSRDQQQVDMKEAREQLAARNREIEQDQARLSQLDEKLSELTPELDRMRSSAASSNDLLERAEAALNEWQQTWQVFNSELNAAQRTIEVEQARIEHLETQRAQLSRQRDTLQAERESISLDEQEQELGFKEQLEVKYRSTLHGLENQLRDTTNTLDVLRAKERLLTEELERLKGELDQRRSNLVTMEALQKVALGREQPAVNEWLARTHLDDRPLLAQQLKVRSPWEKAVETVLGDFLQAISVKDYVPHLDSLPDGNLVMMRSDPDAAMPDAPQTLLGQVEQAAGAAALLARVRIAGGLQEALQIRDRLAADESVITPEGVWLSRHWVRVSSGGDASSGVITREQDIREIQEDISGLENQLQQATDDRRICREQIGETESSLAQLQSDCNLAHQEHAQAGAEATSLRQEVTRLQQRLTSLSDGTQGVHGEIDAVATQIAEARERLTATMNKQSRFEEQGQQLSDEQQNLLDRCDVARTQAEEHRQSLQDLTIEIESRRSSRDSAGTTLERAQAARQQLTDRIEALSQQLNTGEVPLEELEANLEEQLRQKVLIDTELRERREVVEKATEMLRQEEAKRLDRDREVGEIRKTVDAMRVQVREFEVRREAIVDQFNATGLTLEAVNAEIDESATLAEWEGKLERLHRRIERIGAVNLLAIEEFEEQSERKTYLDAQFEDLTNALETLEKAIRRIDRETRSRFQETFENVNSGLKRIFPRLFGGGHAYLSLEGDDLLSSGVSVMAQPPGKRNSHIHLLSGGEKALTAVAMVFSIFELNPAPFCLLDEVDAPLDDSNVIRFCEIVREMSASVQFLFITHNKITMELAGQLMGVTMHEPGVSRLVSVDIDEAVRLAVS